MVGLAALFGLFGCCTKKYVYEHVRHLRDRLAAGNVDAEEATWLRGMIDHLEKVQQLKNEMQTEKDRCGIGHGRPVTTDQDTIGLGGIGKDLGIARRPKTYVLYAQNAHSRRVTLYSRKEDSGKIGVE